MKLNIKIDDIIEALTWKEDMHIINDFSEHVWLKPLYVNGQRIGITECCFYDDPCDWHKSIHENLNKLSKTNKTNSVN